MKLLTATEWAGIAFALSLIVRIAQGYELFNKLFQHRGKIHDREDNLENNRHQDDGEEDDDSKSGNDCDNDNINEKYP